MCGLPGSERPAAVADVLLAIRGNQLHCLSVIWRMLLLLALTMVPSQAQKSRDAEKAKGSARCLRLLPLGETPPFRQDVRDGVRYELEPAAGSIPPRQVRLGTGDEAILIRLNLGRATEPIKIPEGLAAAVFREASLPNEPSTKPWLSIPLPEAGDVLAVVWRDPGTEWNKPRTFIYGDSAAAFPAGSIRIVNLLPTEAALIVGTEQVLLLPGKSLIKTLPIGTDLPIQIAFKNNSGQYQRFHSGSVLLNSNERAQIFIYRADGEKPRQAAKVSTFNEAAPPAATPPP